MYLQQSSLTCQLHGHTDITSAQWDRNISFKDCSVGSRQQAEGNDDRYFSCTPIAFASYPGRSISALAAARAYGPPDPMAAQHEAPLQSHGVIPLCNCSWFSSLLQNVEKEMLHCMCVTIPITPSCGSTTSPFPVIVRLSLASATIIVAWHAAGISMLARRRHRVREDKKESRCTKRTSHQAFEGICPAAMILQAPQQRVSAGLHKIQMSSSSRNTKHARRHISGCPSPLCPARSLSIT